MRLKALLVLCLAFICFYTPAAIAETLPGGEIPREQRIKDLKDLIAFNRLKAKDLKVPPNSSPEEIRATVLQGLEFFTKTAEYSIELAELTTEDKEELAAKKAKIVTELRQIQNKTKAFLEKSISN